MPKLNPKELRERMKQLADRGSKVYNSMKRFTDLQNVIRDDKIERNQEKTDVQSLDSNN